MNRDRGGTGTLFLMLTLTILAALGLYNATHHHKAAVGPDAGVEDVGR